MKKGIVKNLTSVFRRYENRYLPLNCRFVTPDNRSVQFLKNYDVIANRSYLQSLIHPSDTIKMAFLKPDYQSNALIYFINQFTQIETVSDEEIELLVANITNNPQDKIKNIEYEDRDSCTITLSNGREIYFQTITSSFDDVLDICPDLLSDARDRKCHGRSLTLAHYINNKCRCVTGSVWSATPRAKTLHSWVEMDVEDAVLCVDNNMNVVMGKADYYYFMHPKVIESISDKNIDEDIPAINYFIAHSSDKNPYIKLYCSSRNEAIELYNKLISKEKNNSGEYQQEKE
jgi:hypothetical protein